MAQRDVAGFAQLEDGSFAGSGWSIEVHCVPAKRQVALCGRRIKPVDDQEFAVEQYRYCKACVPLHGRRP